ncbi:MAG: zinc-ribbon domain-containing protein [Pirellulales bacterium]
MIHIGTYNWAKTIGAGQFYCSKCLAMSPYRHRSSRPFLTIYFIPVIPIGGTTKFVECSTCKLQYPESIIAPEPSTGDFADDLLHAVCLTILADGVVNTEK